MGPLWGVGPVDMGLGSVGSGVWGPRAENGVPKPCFTGSHRGLTEARQGSLGPLGCRPSGYGPGVWREGSGELRGSVGAQNDVQKLFFEQNEAPNPKNDPPNPILTPFRPLF